MDQHRTCKVLKTKNSVRREKTKLQGERVVTDSSEEDKGGFEDLEVVKGRLHQPKEALGPASLMRQELPDTSSQGPSGTSFLESAIVVAKAGSPPYVASATHQQDEEGSSTETPPVDLSVKPHKDEEG